MDLVILPLYSDLPEGEGLFSEEGMLRLAELLPVLTDDGSPPEAYVIVPRDSPDLLPALASVAQLVVEAGSATVHFVVPAELITADALALLESEGILDLIVVAAPSRDGDARAAAALSEYFDSVPASALMPRLWLARDASGFTLNRARAYQRAGVPAAAITQPLLPLGSDGELRLSDPDSIPPELRVTVRCEVFVNTLTIDAAGDVRACTRHERGGYLGNLLRDEPQSLLEKKVQMAQRVSSSAECLSCRAYSRFAWLPLDPFAAMAEGEEDGALEEDELESFTRRLASWNAMKAEPV